MSYSEYLNGKFTNIEQQKKKPTEAGENVPTPQTGSESLFLESNFATEKSGDGSVFVFSNSENLKNVNYDNIFNENAKSDNALNTVLKDFFSFGNVKESADVNKDGQVSADEAQTYLQQVAGKDGNADNLTSADLQNVFAEHNVEFAHAETPQQPTPETPVQPEVVAEKPEEKLEEKPADKPADKPAQVEVQQNNGDVTTLLPEGAKKGTTFTGVTGNFGSAPVSRSGASTDSAPMSSGNYSSSEADLTPADPLDSMSLEELQAEKTKRTETLKQKQSALNQVTSGKSPKIAAATKKKAEAQKAYEHALKNDNKLKRIESDKYVLNAIKDIDKNNKQRDSLIVKIDETENTIANQESTIENLTAEIDAAKSYESSFSNQLNSLKSSLSGLAKPTGKPEDKAKDAKIAQQKSSLEGKIKAKTKELEGKKKEIASKQKSLDETKKKLEASKASLAKLNEEKTKTEETIKKLEAEKAKLEKIVAANCEASTKAKMDAYNKAVKELDSVKASELQSAKTAKNEALQAVKAVNSKIAVMKNRKASATNLNINQVPASHSKDGIAERTLPNGVKVLTYGYTNYKKLQPELQNHIAVFTQVAQEMGYAFVISDGYRSIEQSNAARARKGNMVAPGGKSPHNYGAGFDCGLYKNGKSVSRAEIERFTREVQRRTNNQIDWGGDWKTKSYETWHYECKDWRRKYKHDNL